ncbi:PAS domain S-box protein [Hymenobacter algoricola]
MNTPDFSASQPPHEGLRALRARAEERRRLVTQITADKSPEEVQRLVQELQVHQIELEMQNEELLLAQAEAEAVRAQYLDLYDFAPAGYFTLSAHGLIRQLNLRGSQLLGSVRQRLTGRRFPLFVAPADRPRFADFLAQVLRAEFRQSCELAMLRDDGTSFFAQLEGVAVQVPDGYGQHEPQCRLAIIDVSARQAALQELAASEARFRQLFEQTSDAIILVQSNVVIDCNPRALQLLGARCKSQLVGFPPWEHATPLLNGQPRADVFALGVAEALRHGSRRAEFTLQRLTGEVAWVESVITPITVSGQPLLHIVWRDITAAKHAAEQLRTSKEQLSLALPGSGTGTFAWYQSTDQVQWDERAQAAFGFARQAAVPTAAVLRRLHPADAPAVQAALQAAVASREPLALQYRIIWPDRSVHHISAAGRVVVDGAGQVQGFAGIVMDVTAQHETQQALRYQSLLTQRMLEAMPVVLARLDAEGRYLEALGQGLHNLGLANESLPGLKALDLFPAPAEEIARLQAGERVEFDNEVDCQGRHYHFHSYAYFDQERRQTMLLAIDVTPLEEQKQQLRREKEFNESLLDNSVDGIMAFDQHGCFLAWNRVLERRTGRLEAELLGQNLFAVFPEWQDKPQEQAIRQVLKGKRLTRYNMPFHTQPGHYESHLVPLLGPDNQVKGGLVLIRDVTERVQLAEEATRLKLRQQQEVLSAILATQEEERKRIAEALHNGVGQLLYAAKLNLENRAPDAPYRRNTLSLLEDAIRATRTISFELTPGILEDFGLKIALEELGKRIPKHNLRIHLNLVGLDRPRPRPVEIALYRVVQELLNNIIRHAQASEAFIHVVHEGRHVHISVEDNGVGIGTGQEGAPPKGIGLAGIHNRIDLLGGELIIESRAGRGTIVTIELTIS